jgi:hypothetical protein
MKFELEKNKKHDAMHEIPKWRPNSRWTPTRFYRLKLLGYLKVANCLSFIKDFFS